MVELIAVFTILFCLVAIGLSVKVYRESPKIKDPFPED
jgi:hypothetical protein